MKKSRKNTASFKSNLQNLVVFIMNFIFVVSCYLIQLLIWSNNGKLPSIRLQLPLLLSIAVILLVCFMLLLFFIRITLDKKVLISLGLTAIALGLLGFFDLIIKNNISFVDAVYRTLQLFVGEFNDIPHEPGSFPIMLNISRFLALFVTFGAISVLLLREKIAQLNIRLFYKDVVIITDNIDKQTTALADKLSDAGHKIVFGLINPTQEISFKSNELIPVIEFDIDKTLVRGLAYCNIGKAKCIYLFCENTSDNILLFRAIKKIFENIKESTDKSHKHTEPAEKDTGRDQMLEHLYSSLKDKTTLATAKKAGRHSLVKCFIQYKTYSEKEYYSIDTSLSEKSNRLETYFINPDINALRQMISGISLRNLICISPGENIKTAISRMRNVKIGVAGSGPLLECAANEIPRLCTFTDSENLDIYFLGGMSESIRFKAAVSNSRMSDSVNIHDVSLGAGNNRLPEIGLLFICSESEMQIKSIVHSVFQSGLNKNIKELLILTEGNHIEFEILSKYISHISGQQPFISDYSFSTIYLGNTVDLIMSIDDFYNSYGPDIHSVHEAYMKSMNSGLISDFNKLPEELIESNLLTSIHNHLILGFLSSLFPESPKAGITMAEFRELIEYLASVEHERWYRERLLQGYVLADTHDYLLNKNPYMKHWALLDDGIKDKNIDYLLNALQVQCDRQTAAVFDVCLPEIIRQMSYSPESERRHDEL